jgi:hypothetical protein
LLFTVSPEDGQKLLSNWESETAVTHIGEIVNAPGCQLKLATGDLRPLEPIGWTHTL